MKELILWTCGIVIIAIFIVGGLYYFGPYMQKKDIFFTMDYVHTPQHKGLASTCFKKKFTQYMCCLESVETMYEAHVMPINDAGCGTDMKKTSLDCAGSFEWCVPRGQ